MVPKAKSRLVCLEVAELEDGQDGGGDGEEGGVAGHHGLRGGDVGDVGVGDGEEGDVSDDHGPAGFRLCFGFSSRAFLVISFNSFSFLHPVNVGSGMIKERFKEVNGHDMNGLT